MNTPENPQTEIDQLDQQIKAPLSIHAKGYLWALQQPGITACISDMKAPAEVEENLSIFTYLDT